MSETKERHRVKKKVPSAKSTASLKESKKQKTMAAHLLDTSWMVALPFVVFAIGGLILDKNIGTTPLFFFIGLFIAIAIISVKLHRYIEYYFPGSFKGLMK